jgi:uncharacterized protein DUF4411
VTYLLDANVFIQAKNQYYGFDIVPAFWDWLISANTTGNVYSIEKVAEELVGFGDELSDWTKARLEDGTFFLEPDDAVLEGLKDVAAWVQGQGFAASAVNEFLQVADYYLVAQALVQGHVVVTQEVYEATLRKVKIPNACVGLGIQWMNTYAMLRAEGASF